MGHMPRRARRDDPSNAKKIEELRALSRQYASKAIPPAQSAMLLKEFAFQNRQSKRPAQAKRPSQSLRQRSSTAGRTNF